MDAITTFDERMALDQLRGRWIGRKVRGSSEWTDRPATRTVMSIHRNGQDRLYYAWTEDAEGHGEHHRANTLDALDRRLQSLA